MARPSSDYVRVGDRLRVAINLKWANFSYTAAMSTSFKNAVSNQGFAVLGFDDSSVGRFVGGTMWIDVMPQRSDFSHAQDVAGLLGGIATQAGFSVDSTSAQIVSYVENTGGAAAGGFAPAPLSPFQSLTTGGSITDVFGMSPTSLLLIGFGLFIVLPLVRDVIAPPRRR